jgi:predicted transcriptional regulator
MSGWFWLLAGALVLPPLGQRLSGRVARSVPRARRSLTTAWLVLSLAFWSALALQGGRQGGAPQGGGWSGGTIAWILAAGLLWVEGWTLHGLARRRVLQSPGAMRGASDVAPLFSGETEPSPAPPWPGEIADALLDRIRQCERVPVERIMTPREEILFSEIRQPVGSALSAMRHSGRSRVPVVTAGSLDQVVGIVHAKDLVPLALGESSGDGLRRHLRRWLRVPRGQSIARLLEDFRGARVHVGIIGDAMGRTLGLVTLGDIFRFLAGAGPIGEDGGRGSDGPPRDRGREDVPDDLGETR